jgi:acylphosphatase
LLILEIAERRYKLMVKSKLDLSTEEVKTTLCTNVNSTAMKVGIRSLKSLKDGRVLIEAGTTEEINKLRQTIQEKCREKLEMVMPQLRKPRVIINNVPNDITVENLEVVIIAQNPELELAEGDMDTKFRYTTKRGQNKIVIEVGPKTRKKLKQKKLKIGWQICNAADYLVAMRCFRCSRFNHRHNECKNEEICPLCTGGHKLKECKAPADQHKCINCTTYNTHSKTGRINENHSSLDKNCPSLQAVLAKYRQDTDY